MLLCVCFIENVIHTSLKQFKNYVDLSLTTTFQTCQVCVDGIAALRDCLPRNVYSSLVLFLSPQQQVHLRVSLIRLDAVLGQRDHGLYDVIIDSHAALVVFVDDGSGRFWITEQDVEVVFRDVSGFLWNLYFDVGFTFVFFKCLNSRNICKRRVLVFADCFPSDFYFVCYFYCVCFF